MATKTDTRERVPQKPIPTTTITPQTTGTSNMRPVAEAVQRAQDAAKMTPTNVRNLQRAVGNRTTRSMLQTKLQVSAPGDRYEQEADQVAARVMDTPDAEMAPGQSKMPAPTISRANQPTVQRWALGTGWGVFTDPVHETLTQMSLSEAGYITEEDSNKEKKKKSKEYITGARWNDNPEGQLEGMPIIGLAKFGIAFKWGNEEGLTHRSHEGDMQFLHGMAEAGEEAAVTQGKILMWSEFTYKVGKGEIPHDTLLKEVPVEGISALFPGEMGDLAVGGLFGTDKADVTQQRAVGSLLHMLQDTYAFSHSQREDNEDGTSGNIVSFLAYGDQDSSRHKKGDVPAGPGKNLEEKIRNSPNAFQAVQQGARVLTLLKEGKPWDEVKPVIEEIFGLAEHTHTKVAGPGEFVKETLPTLKEFKKSTSVWFKKRSSDSNLSRIDAELEKYDKIRDKIKKDNEKYAILTQLRVWTQIWIDKYDENNKTQKKRLLGVKALREKVLDHRLFK